MSVLAIHSTLSDLTAAVGEVAAGLQAGQPKLVVYFASSHHDPATVAAAMQEQLPDATLIGCTTAGEITSGHMLDHGLVAMGLGADVVGDLSVQVLEGVADGDLGVEAAFDAFAAHFGAHPRELDLEHHVGLVLVDGMTGCEERLMEKLGDLTDVPFVGASAGDDLRFETTHVFANGKAHQNAVVLALLKLERGYSVLKTQSFKPTDTVLTATRVDEGARTVHEFDGKPAVEAYAAAIGVDPAQAADHFMRYPVGVMVGDEPYVRSPQRLDGTSMAFYCHIKQGMQLKVLEAGDITKTTQADLQRAVEGMPSCRGVINFHCILRTLELKAKDQLAAYGQVFKDLPTVGFSTYGEEYIGHLNQTSTILLLE